MKLKNDTKILILLFNNNTLLKNKLYYLTNLI